jgi:hypothetical protein
MRERWELERLDELIEQEIENGKITLNTCQIESLSVMVISPFSIAKVENYTCYNFYSSLDISCFVTMSFIVWLKTMAFGLRWTLWILLGRDASKLSLREIDNIHDQSTDLLVTSRRINLIFEEQTPVSLEEQWSRQIGCNGWCSKPSFYFRFLYKGSDSFRLGYAANFSSAGIFHGPFTDYDLGRRTVEQLRTKFLASRRPFMTAFTKILQTSQSLKSSFLQSVRPLP